MIGDLTDFLEFSETNIEWQYRRELQAIAESETEGWPDYYKEHLETNAEHRFKVSLPLRVRYGAVVALTTSVEWSTGFLKKALKVPLGAKPKKCNEAVHALRELREQTGVEKSEVVSDYEAIAHVRNCIAHNAGIEEHYRYRKELSHSVSRLHGFTLEDRHVFLRGKHVWIEKGALNPYVREMGELIVSLYRATHEQGLLRKLA